MFMFYFFYLFNYCFYNFAPVILMVNIYLDGKHNKRGSLNIIIISGGRPANFDKPCPNLSNRVNVKGENDNIPSLKFFHNLNLNPLIN